MARYPTFEEYRKRGNFHDGIKRCDDLLKKNANDVQLLIVKLQLLHATAGDAQAVLQQLSSLQPPILDLGEIAAIEDAVENAQRDVYPQPSTAGPIVATIWDNAFKASNSMNHKLDLLSLRFSRAVVDTRLLDAQQSLIQLKALQPKNRIIYMAHLAVTQLLSSSKEDLQSRLALSLARKAIKENFDEDKSLDCRVPGQIFAVQASQVDLESIAGRSFAESKQVYDACKRKASEMNGDTHTQPAPDPATISPAEWISSEVQSLKQQFARLISSSASLPIIRSFAANSIRLFHTAMKSISNLRGRGLADSGFLSISALIRMFELCSESRHLLHAAFLAEMLLKHNPHVHEARLILVYLYMNLGLGSLAIHMFNSLNVKEIQHDTVGHVLFTRLSITHPHSTRVNKRDVYDPQKKLSHAVAVYTRHEEKLAETEASVLNHEQTGMMFDLRELRNCLRSSITRRITYIEQRRIARLLHSTDGDAPTPMGPRLTANWLKVTDNRDFAAAFDFGYNVEKVLHGHNSVLPGATWILYGLFADCAWCLARGAPMPVKDPKTLVEDLSTLKLGLDLDRLQIGDDQPANADLTRAEIIAGRLAYQVLKELLRFTSRLADTEESVGAVLAAVRSLDVDSVVNSKVICAEGIQDSYVYLDSLRVVLAACTYMTGKTSKGEAELQDIQTLAKAKCSVLLENARSQAKRVNGPAIRTDMEQDEMIRDTVKLFGDISLTEFCNSVASSAQEGWEGLTMIKVG